jgi:MFS family permease
MSQALEYPNTAIPDILPLATGRMARAWWAVCSRFLIHGLVISTWVSRIPSIKAALHLNDGIFGFTLLGGAVGSVVGIPLCGWAVTRFGSRTACTWTSLGLCASLIPIAFAFNAPTLFVTLFVLGAMAGSNDVAMNAQGVAVERLMGSPTMSRFHGMFSLAGIIGAAGGGVLAARAIPVKEHFLITAVIFLAFSLFTAPQLLESRSETPAIPTPKLRLRHLPTALIALSVIGFCIFLSEGAIADWTALYLKQVLGAGPGIAAAGYAVFSAAMAIFRFFGDAITVRLGPARTIRAGGIIAACGLAWALMVHSPYWALPGFGLAGVGFSSIIPLVFAAGGRIKSVSEGAGVATVSGIGYLGFLVGPPVIGFIAQMTSLRIGLFFIVLLSATAAALVTLASNTENT